MFYDRAELQVKAGRGGNGSASFRREKYIPRGGPDGGSGGEGGDIILKANAQLNTLVQYKYEHHFEAEDGGAGTGQNCHGKNGEDRTLEVPIGTIVQLQTDDGWQPIADLTEAGETFTLAKGGRGGLGNARLATPSYRAPHFAQLGEPGEEKSLRLELKLVADVGLVGYPNAGKSTLISVITNAKPKIADYPFTTLIPNLGVVKHRDQDFVVADIPGLIEGASQGKGLGDEFLRHIERTRVLVHLLDGSKADPDQLLQDWEAINHELTSFNTAILDKPQLVVVTKTDLLSPEQQEAISQHAGLQAAAKRYAPSELGYDKPLLLSAVTHVGTTELLDHLTTVLKALPKQVEKTVSTVQVINPLEENERIFRIEKQDGVYHVIGKRAKRIAITTDTNNEEAVVWMQDRLKAMGVYAELEKVGIESGDTVEIAGVRFEWN